MMELHRRISLIFGGFSAFSLLMNIITPSNPDHLWNLVEMSCILLAFALSYFFDRREGGALQIFAIVVAAFFTISSPSGPFFGSVLAVFGIILTYAYDGYRTVRVPKFILTACVVFFLAFFASSTFQAPFVWTAFVMVFCTTLLLIVDDINRRFYDEKVKSLTELNAELLSMNKKLLGECENAPGKP
jgi:hypothetical protein